LQLDKGVLFYKIKKVTRDALPPTQPGPDVIERQERWREVVMTVNKKIEILVALHSSKQGVWSV
jgi:hypothetical protein